MSTILLHPITEMRRFLQGALREFRGSRHVDGELIIEGALDVQADVEKVATLVRDTTHKAETCDREATKIIDDVLADGRVDPSEIAALRKARRLTNRSAELDHDASEIVRGEAA
jgi:hypothetical protein